MYMEGKKFCWATESTENDFWEEEELMWRLFNIQHVKIFHEYE